MGGNSDKKSAMNGEFIITLLKKVIAGTAIGAFTFDEAVKILQPFVEGDVDQFVRTKFDFNTISQPADQLQGIRDIVYRELPIFTEKKQIYDRENNTDWKFPNTSKPQ